MRLLWTRERRYDLESYTAIHMGVIFGLLTLVTGSIWAKISWGDWWTWGERQLVLFLILFLFYSSYFMLRYSIDPGPRRERNSAVYALFGVVLIPVSFLAVRIAGTILHPTIFTHEGARSRHDAASPSASASRGCWRSPRPSTRSSWPGSASTRACASCGSCWHDAPTEKYVTAAYLVLLGAVLVYLLIIALKVGRLEQELADLTRAGAGRSGVAELLFWPALLAYGEAAFAYAGDARHPGSMGRLATWGVRVGWLVQTALLVAQAARADGFPWDTWAGSLNLFVWLVVGAYLIWGCRPRYRLLGLVVMPLAALLLAVSYAAGGVDASGRDRVLDALPRPPRRAPARRLRGPHARGRARGALPLAGAAAQAAQLDRAPLPRALARRRSSRSSREPSRSRCRC